MQVRHVSTTIHGRFLHVDRGADCLLVGFHGYAETADPHLEEIQKIPGIGGWSIAAVQALHPFYTRSGAVVANWMTKQDRELAIEDNLHYVQQVIRSLPRPRSLVFLGFSQGAAMAVRAAAYAGAHPAGLVLLGGEIPPEIMEDGAVRLPPVLLGRGTRDEWYTDEKFKNDLSFLESKTRVTRCVFPGGHEWTDAFRDAIGEFLAAMNPDR